MALRVAHQLIDDGAPTIYLINTVTLVQAVTPRAMPGA
jgi:hypothetical protein